MKATMKICDIKISAEYQKHYPSKYKMDKCRSHYLKTGECDRDIRVDKDGFLSDGYVMYLVLKENNVVETTVIRPARYKDGNKYSPTYYVFGVHKFDGKEYVWKLKPNKRKADILPGDKVIVDTKYGNKEIYVTRLEMLDKPPFEAKIRNVIRRV